MPLNGNVTDIWVDPVNISETNASGHFHPSEVICVRTNCKSEQSCK